MVISNVQQVRMDQLPAGSGATSYVVRLTATAPDAIAIANLTRANLLKKILISVDEEPIVAPTVFEIIENGELEISSTNRAEIEPLRSRLMISR